MKRILQDYVGRPMSEKQTPDVVGRPSTRSVMDFASFLSVERDAADSDAGIVNEFAEFLAGPADLNEPVSGRPDPVFKERLRRRLWRLHLLTRPTNSHDSH
jgi:hypothetical protein